MSLRIPTIVDNWISRPLVSKIVSFGLIGIANGVVDLTIFTIAYKIGGVSLVPANVIAWSAAVSCSYVLNSMFTFRAESGRRLHLNAYVTFAASGILGMIVTTTTLVLLSRIMPVFAAKLASIVAGFVVNFSMSHYLVFRSKIPSEQGKIQG